MKQNLVKQHRFLFTPLILVSLCVIALPYHVEINLTQAHLTPSFEHWLGTDPLGRDILCYSIQAGLIDLCVAGVLTSSNILLGSFFACCYAMSSIKKRQCLRYLMVALKSVPKILLILISILSPSPLLAYLLLSCTTQWASFSLTTKQRLTHQTTKAHYIDAKLNQYPTYWIGYYHLLPAIQSYTLKMLPYQLMQSISALMTLRYLGYGFNQSYPTLGQIMLDQKYQLDPLNIGWCALICLLIYTSTAYLCSLLNKKGSI
jgi:ABC-type dipeptide/oligopeptide/nickel transport system permease subunit